MQPMILAHQRRPHVHLIIPALVVPDVLPGSHTALALASVLRKVPSGTSEPASGGPCSEEAPRPRQWWCRVRKLPLSHADASGARCSPEPALPSLKTRPASLCLPPEVGESSPLPLP